MLNGACRDGRWPSAAHIGSIFQRPFLRIADILRDGNYNANDMKFSELKSIGHNVADSLSSGIGLLVGCYEMNVYGEASSSLEGYMIVDFLTGETEGAQPSNYLRDAILRYKSAFGSLCQKHGVEVGAFKTLKAKFAVDARYGGHFTVTVEDQNGRRSVDHYIGVPGRRIRMRR
jgi:hypothetical protein